MNKTYNYEQSHRFGESLLLLNTDIEWKYLKTVKQMNLSPSLPLSLSLRPPPSLLEIIYLIDVLPLIYFSIQHGLHNIWIFFFIHQIWYLKVFAKFVVCLFVLTKLWYFSVITSHGMKEYVLILILIVREVW